MTAAHGLGTARSWLYVPAHRPELLDKALAGPADAVVLDLEDAVPPASKQLAREVVLDVAHRPRAKPLWVRMNVIDSPWATADVDALAGCVVDGVRVPKATDPDTVALLGRRLGLPLHVLLESALGVENAHALARAHPSVVGVSLGEADLAADLRVRDRAALAWARQRVVVASRAAGLPGPLASVWTDLADAAGLAADSVAARDQGFSGRSVIHPRQIAAVHRAFTPTAEEIATARGLLASLDEAVGRGESAFLDADGRFVDPAVVAGARWVLERAPDPDQAAASAPESEIL